MKCILYCYTWYPKVPADEKASSCPLFQFVLPKGLKTVEHSSIGRRGRPSRVCWENCRSLAKCPAGQETEELLAKGKIRK